MERSIIEDFISDEELALRNGAQGSFFPGHHHLIKPEFKKKFEKLPPNVVQSYYFHSLRIGNFPFEVSERSFPLLLKAVDQLVVLFQAGRGYPICLFRRFEALFLFGYDGVAAREAPQPLALETFKERLELSKKARQYVHIPGMLDKLDKLKVFAENPRLLEQIHFTLRRSGFVHGGSRSSDFLFWTLMAVVMIRGGSESERTIELFLKSEIPEKDAHLELYRRFSEALS